MTNSATSDLLDNFSKLAVIVPIAHILSCSLFLAGYMAGFAGNLSSLFQISDLFNISFSSVISIYVTGLLVPAFALLMLDRSEFGSRTARAVVRNKLRGRVLLITALVFLFAVLFTFPAVLDKLDWDPLHALYFQGILYVLAILLGIRFKLYALPHLPLFLVFVVFSFGVGAFGQGNDEGARDRRTPFLNLAKDHFYCDDFIILRRVGDLYISARRDQRRIAIDKDCKIKFEFELTPVFQYKRVTLHNLGVR